MLIFWTLTGLMAALAGWLVLSAARGGATRASTPLADAGRVELDELDRLKARGLLDEAGWSAARAEAGRRLLADRTPEPTLTASALDGRLVLGGVVACVAAALGLYLLVGQLGLSDQPYERRVDAWSSSPETLEPAQVAAVVGRVARQRPNDHTAQTMLGAARFQAGDPLGAASAFRRAVAIQPNDAQSWARLGESLVRAADGRIGADAEAAFARSLELDPDQLGARYFLGEAALRRGDAARTRTMWGPLIAALDPADPRRADLEARLSGAAS